MIEEKVHGARNTNVQPDGEIKAPTAKCTTCEVPVLQDDWLDARRATGERAMGIRK